MAGRPRPRVLDAAEVDEALRTRLPSWHREGAELVLSVQCPSYAAGIRLVDAVAEVADEVDHHPDVDIRWTTVTFRLSTHWVGGLTERDLDLAGRIDQLARRA